MKVYCPTCNTVHVTCGEAGYGGAVNETGPLDYVNRRLDALEKELRYAISCNKEAIERESANRKDLLGSLERKVAGYFSEIARRVGVPAPSVCSDDSDSKDALIRDLMTWLSDHHVYPYVTWNDTKNGFRDRAEKLGIKL